MGFPEKEKEEKDNDGQEEKNGKHGAIHCTSVFGRRYVNLNEMKIRRSLDGLSEEVDEVFIRKLSRRVIGNTARIPPKESLSPAHVDRERAREHVSLVRLGVDRPHRL